MIIYSKRIFQFINDIKSTIKAILSSEVGLRVSRDRFYERSERVSYPIKVVVYNNKALLGYFSPHFYELGFHESLMYTTTEQLHDVIRHELAHYITFINHGEGVLAHGHEFRAFCAQMGWGEKVYRASTCLEGDATHIEESAVFRKVQKLMALAKSSNQNEAESAMIKSQQLLLKHNIETKYIESEDDEKIFLKRVLKQKRENAKMRAIATILETFFVSIVYLRSGDCVHLEILGSAVNVEIAEYVAEFLQDELEKLWSQAQIEAHLKGKVAKNSFFLGLARGYCNKIQALKREYQNDVAHALMVIEKKLAVSRALVYERLSRSQSNGSYCKESSLVGERMGRNLSINPGITRSLNPGTLLTY